MTDTVKKTAWTGRKRRADYTRRMEPDEMTAATGRRKALEAAGRVRSI
jgi:hypothetical protein